MKPAALTALLLLGPAGATTIADINGRRFLSPLRDAAVANVTGLVTAVADQGVYLRSTARDDDDDDDGGATSEGLFVFFGSAVAGAARVGDELRVDGRVREYRRRADDLFLTQLAEPAKVEVLSAGHAVRPRVVGVDTPPPPTRAFSRLDGRRGVFGLPNAVARVSDVDPALDPAAYGLDFWESLTGELVTLPAAHQASRPNRHGDVWVRGRWPVTGLNAHGGVTMLEGDANPETIVVGTPLDGSANPRDTKMGDYLGDITGVVSYAFGSYRVLPLTRLSPRRRAPAEHPATSLASSGRCDGLTVADYNVENLAPQSAHMARVVDDIVAKLRVPDLLFLQEIQDGSGPRDDGVVSANRTLAALAARIEAASGVAYRWADVEPVDGDDGGQPGGNIRCAYLYRPDVVELHRPRQGASLDANQVLDGPELSFNPGRIDPSNPAFDHSRKPVAAAWKTLVGPPSVFFTVNVHFGSKGGSTSLHGDARPPVNKGVEKRTQQAAVTAAFIAQILEQDPQARVIAAGDFNEFTQVEPLRLFAEQSGLVDLDDAAGLDPVERYTYLFDMNSEALDHMYVSPASAKGARVEHLHLNTWRSLDDQTSDHDPSVARLNLCGGA